MPNRSSLLLCALVVSVVAVPAAQTGGDAALFEKIRVEGMEHSQAEALFETLTTDIGPRLTASPAHKRAAEWAREKLAGYGLADSHL